MKKSHRKRYAAIWRWHFYAGIIITPILLILAFTGAVYLFKYDIEAALYKDYYQVEAVGDPLTPEEQVDIAQNEIDGSVTRYRPGEGPERSAEVAITTEDGTSYTVFVDPYDGTALGVLNDDRRVMDIIEKVHGELMAGTVGDRLVELVACWTIIMIITGIYLWFPRKAKDFRGILIPRLKQGTKILIRDLHAVTGFWWSGGLIFFLLTGLLWTGFWGNGVQNITTMSGAGYPPSIWIGPAPESDVKTEEVADVSWAAENLPAPTSEILSGRLPVSINDVVNRAQEIEVHPTYDVFYPASEEGVFTLSTFPDQAQDEATVHIDQYSGITLADYRFVDYGILGKIMALGITIHKGLQFGLINQLFGLAICLGLIAMIITGFWMWLRRKPKDSTGAPASDRLINHKVPFFILIVLSLIFPLVGLSLIAVFLIDLLILQRIPKVRKWLNVKENRRSDDV
ncbi:PepSY-associated TM helix domain-containing protein [Salinicoccus hispanicus]|uniref:PepSY domain-containing protein n=1 Tax=Salinicoccus hispanicus TaxID=157225 RepID=A0A6N8U0B4_9STAP|nr:PepSY domain-containing protein [Salinicoccus hispanicus]MXQ51514.1 PepSY domain-containing protein [Salinicoccus hispanicus]